MRDDQEMNNGDMSLNEWLNFGVNHIAYCRPVLQQGKEVISIHAADGTQLSVVPSMGMAWMAIRDNEMEPVPLH
ncbi:MAG: DUF1150 family protein [Alphaproteobacteria bacterium]